MAEPEERGPESAGSAEQIPLMQRVLDNPFILLFLGITVPAVKGEVSYLQFVNLNREFPDKRGSGLHPLEVNNF